MRSHQIKETFLKDYKAHVKLQLEAGDRGSLTLEYVNPWAHAGAWSEAVAVDARTRNNKGCPITWRILRFQTYVIWLAFVRSNWEPGLYERPQLQDGVVIEALHSCKLLNDPTVGGTVYSLYEAGKQ